MMPNKMLVTDWFNRMTKKRERERENKKRKNSLCKLYLHWVFQFSSSTKINE